MNTVVEDNIGHYAKSLLYIGLAGAGVLITALSDNHLSDVEFISVLIAFLGAVPVYLIPNAATGVWKYAKTIVAFVVAALTALAAILVNGAGISGVSLADWLNVAVVAFAAIGVSIIPNTVAKTVPVDLVESDQLPAPVLADTQPMAEVPDGKSGM